MGSISFIIPLAKLFLKSRKLCKLTCVDRRCLPSGKGKCGSCWRRAWLSRVSCEVCFAKRSFSSIRSLFKAVSFAFTLTSLVASLRCFSRHLTQGIHKTVNYRRLYVITHKSLYDCQLLRCMTHYDQSYSIQVLGGEFGSLEGRIGHTILSVKSLVVKSVWHRRLAAFRLSLSEVYSNISYWLVWDLFSYSQVSSSHQCHWHQ